MKCLAILTLILSLWTYSPAYATAYAIVWPETVTPEQVVGESPPGFHYLTPIPPSQVPRAEFFQDQEGATQWYFDSELKQYWLLKTDPNYPELLVSNEIMGSLIYPHFGYKTPLTLKVITEDGVFAAIRMPLHEPLSGVDLSDPSDIQSSYLRKLRLISPFLRDQRVKKGTFRNVLFVSGKVFLFNFGGAFRYKLREAEDGTSPGVGLFEATTDLEAIAVRTYATTLGPDHLWTQVNETDALEVKTRFDNLFERTLRSLVYQVSYSDKKDSDTILSALLQRRRAYTQNLLKNFRSGKLHVFEKPAPQTDTLPLDIVKKIQSKGKKVVTFIGYSGGSFENFPEMLQLARTLLNEYNPDETMITVGATSMGIGAVYGVAKDLGFETMGIVSSLVRKGSSGTSPHCDQVYVVDDQQYGGFSRREMAAHLTSRGKPTSPEAPELNVCGSDLFSTEEMLAALASHQIHLTPTSQAMIDVSDIIIGIGGGPTSCAELLYAVFSGKTVHYFPRRMNPYLSKGYFGQRLWGEAYERLNSLTSGTFPNFHPNPRQGDGF